MGTSPMLAAAHQVAGRSASSSAVTLTIIEYAPGSGSFTIRDNVESPASGHRR